MEYITLGLFYCCPTYDGVVQVLNDYGGTTYPNITIDDINEIYLIPSKFIPVEIVDDNPFDLTFAISQSGGFPQPIVLEDSISKPSSIDNYTPKNKKLLTKQFNYLVVTNEVGATEDFAYEHFKTNDCNFYLSAIPSVTGNAILTPQSYGNAELSEPFPYDYAIYGLPLGKFPMISINFDYYRMWLDKNIFNITTGGLEAGIESIAGAIQLGVNASTGTISGNDITKTLGVYGYAYDLFKELHMKKKIPPVTISQTSSSEIYVSGNYNYLGFSFYQFCIKREYAELIDNFFSMFGYKVNEVKIPNIEGRRNWNYVKLLNPNVEGSNIPEFELNEFKKQLENGITFWHNPATFRDYSQDNSIV